MENLIFCVVFGDVIGNFHWYAVVDALLRLFRTSRL